jgi:hypothetical protein
MRSFLSRRPSPAMAVAFIALLAALSGTAVALPGTNTVDSGDIKKGNVKRSDLGRNAVTSSKVKDGSLLANDFKAGELPAGPRGPQGATGPTGPQGATGPTGPAGADGTAQAFASVNNSGPSLDMTRTKNFTAVSRPSTGVYCLTPAAGIAEAGTAAVVVPEWIASIGDNLFAMNVEGSFGCSAGQFAVRTFTLSGGNLVLSNIVDFHIVVP